MSKNDIIDINVIDDINNIISDLEVDHKRIKVDSIYDLEDKLWDSGYKYIAGCDEVGRGPMAGPVVVASVVLDKNKKIDGLNDSKKLSHKKRCELAEIIKKEAIEYTICYIDVDEVDRINVYESSRKGMMDCVSRLKNVDLVISDCMKFDCKYPLLSLIKGDATSASVAASSIIAQVERDNYMINLSKEYPNYGFDKHKGYVTKMHLDAIKKYGICIHHRKSFDPVKRIIDESKKD